MESLGDFVSALIGALIGGLATLLATWWYHCLESRRKEREVSESINATLQAIKSELRCLRERYDESIGHQLEATKDGTPFLFYYYATDGYFTIYTQNASLIGQIPSDSLRKNIIAVYIVMKGLLDTYKNNSAMLEKYEYYRMLFLETNLPIHKQQETAYYTSLLNYLPSLKGNHKQAVDLGHQLIEDITDYLDSQRIGTKKKCCLC